jgi:hypothetical protein
MMCIRHGAAYVIGCEMFEAMAEVAREVIRHNGMDDRILVVSAKSCDIESLPFAPDIVISELLDSALLGEGVVFSHADAIERFIDPAPNPAYEPTAPENDIRLRVLPYAATVSGALVESIELLHMVTVDPACLGGCSPVRARTPSESAQGVAKDKVKCPWGRMLPVHWETQLQDRGEGARLLSAPAPLLQVEFFHTSTEAPGLGGGKKIRLTALEKGTVHGLLVWWKADLLAPELLEAEAAEKGGQDDSQQFSYSTEPGSTHCWQDHWQQAVYPFGGLSGGYECEAGDVLEVTTSHDGLHMWCSVEKVSSCPATAEGTCRDEANLKRARLSTSETPRHQSEVVEPTPNEQCRCGWHLLCGPERMQSLSDARRLQQWQQGVASLVARMLQMTPPPQNPDAIPLVLDVSDGSTLAFMAAVELARCSSAGHGVVGRVVLWNASRIPHCSITS